MVAGLLHACISSYSYIFIFGFKTVIESTNLLCICNKKNGHLYNWPVVRFEIFMLYSKIIQLYDYVYLTLHQTVP